MQKRTLKLTLRFCLCIGLTIIAARPTEAANSSLVFTEISSTSLTATLDGTPLAVTNASTDSWLITFPAIIEPLFSGAIWAEPPTEASTTRNVWSDTPEGFNDQAEFFSDFTSPDAANPNGSTVTSGAFLLTDPIHGGGVFLDVTVNDLGDAPSQVPEPSTLMMLVALLGVGIIARKAFTWRRQFRT